MKRILAVLVLAMFSLGATVALADDRVVVYKNGVEQSRPHQVYHFKKHHKHHKHRKVIVVEHKHTDASKPRVELKLNSEDRR